MSHLRGRKVLVTGHTGFKGSWLVAMLQQVGAIVYGYSLPSPFTPAHGELAGFSVPETIADIRDRERLWSTIARIRPEIIFHLAAQPIVLDGYDDPLTTLETNIMGTAYVLEGCRREAVPYLINVTTDKVYENNEWCWGYRESDTLWGKDPYSGSKVGAELVSSVYEHSYFAGATRMIVARAGNVIGGGDWSRYRIIPDLVRAVLNKTTVEIRNPGAIRPWQHVLDVCAGYLRLAEAVLSGDPAAVGAWNIGPRELVLPTVGEIVNATKARFGSALEVVVNTTRERPEMNTLKLDGTKMAQHFGWYPRWSSEEAVARTLDWYQAYVQTKQAITRDQMEGYLTCASPSSSSASSTITV